MSLGYQRKAKVIDQARGCTAAGKQYSKQGLVKIYKAMNRSRSPHYGVKLREELDKKEEVRLRRQRVADEKRFQETLKLRQRNEIYALNAAMKKLEEDRFLEYKQGKSGGIKSPVPESSDSAHRLGAV
eukprot:sb/3475335/